MKPRSRPPSTPSRLWGSPNRQRHRYPRATWGAVTFILLALAALAQAQTFSTLHNFAPSPDGAYPLAGVVRDSYGNLYGATAGGGANSDGVVFELNTAGAETVLYSFTGGSSDGFYPSAPLLRDSTGTLYGTAPYGGAHGNGVVFEVDSAGKETILYNFLGGTTDGCYPLQGLVSDKASNLYGTTYSCGASGSGCDGYGCGTVFKLTPQGQETLLHSFMGGASDGAEPEYGHLRIDKQGDLYGLTELGGTSNNGALYKLTPQGNLRVLHSFAGGTADGCLPVGTTAVDKAGNFYGTASNCGASSNGTVWKVSKKAKETILHNFAGGVYDGCAPFAGVVLDSDGNLYGSSAGCGAYSYGTVYELNKTGAFLLLHSFGPGEGCYPYGEVLRDAKGSLYGTTYGGGTYNYGTVWSYVP